MSENSTLSVKTSRRQQVLAYLTFRDRASSSSSFSLFRLNQTVTSSTAQIRNSSFIQTVFSSTASVESILTDLLIADVASLSSSQTISTFSSSSNLLHDALKWLSDDDRATLQDYMFHNVSNINLTLEQVLVATKKKQRCCIEKRWTFTFMRQIVVVKEKIDKMIDWLNQFTTIEDVVTNVDFVHVSLSWADIRLLLEIKARAFKWIIQRSYVSIDRLSYLRWIRWLRCLLNARLLYIWWTDSEHILSFFVSCRRRWPESTLRWSWQSYMRTFLNSWLASFESIRLSPLIVRFVPFKQRTIL